MNRYSFSYFHSDSIPNSLLATQCPAVDCELVCFKNDPNSTGNVYIGSIRLSVVGTSIQLEPGKVTSWIPAHNLNLFWHKEEDTSTFLQYALVGRSAPLPEAVLLQEVDLYPLLLEDRQRIRL